MKREASPSFSEIVARFRDPIPVPGKVNVWQCFCPYHKAGMERRRSLRIWITSRGNLCFRCFACGDELKRDILACVGLTMSDLFADSAAPPIEAYHQPRPKLVEKFTYEDEQRRPLYQVWRYDPKAFCQMRFEDGQYKAGLMALRRVLYRLPELISAPRGSMVFVAEGERKVELLRSWGLIATCNVGGAGMGWRDEYSLSLSNRPVAVLPDNNRAGFKHADIVAGSAIRFGAASVRVVCLPNLPDGGDILDWVKAGGNADAFLALVAETTPYMRTPF